MSSTTPSTETRATEKQAAEKPPKAGLPKARPLSPHLQIYKPQLTSMLSILHRLTGIALTGGLVILVVWLAALATGPESYANFIGYTHNFVSQIILIGISLAYCYHLCSGIRHLLWDSGFFLDIKDVYKTGRIVVIAALILTAIIWLNVYGVGL